ncbi:alkaline phosphatase [Croceimicrobium sp.]|uniref:alkaline phosphatase n=1 Tax=Croceimicrobium sp. TaxID=2828340 RepID=UPI003BA96AC0
MPKAKRPNIILMIGDGMGHAQLSTALFYGNKEPQYLRFPIVGLSRTSSSSHKITDSAAGATAFSCGVKTYNGSIGMAADTTALETILEYLDKENWKTGVIATSSITHATPASFYAHVPLRKQEFEIAEQFLSAQVDFAAGGGKRFFFNRLDERNLYPDFAKAGIEVDTTALEAKEWQKDKRYAYLLAKDGMIPVYQGRDEFLPNATAMALDYFDATAADEPFFMMVEGSQIDWGGHANNGEYLVNEMLDFDKAIGVALDYAEKDGNTIVIVTADHECGGFAMVSEEVEVPFRGKQNDYDSLRFSFGSGGHSSTMVPVLAYGPGTQVFSGIYQNNSIYQKMMMLAGYN